MIRRIVRIGVDSPVLLNLIFLVVVIAGLLSWAWIPKEEFPQVTADRVIVSVPFPGAAPLELEEEVIRSVEDALDGVDGLEHVYVDAVNGIAMHTLEFVHGTDVDEAYDEVESVIRARDDLPEDALEPIVSIARLTIPLMHVGLTGDTRQRALADSLVDELLAFPGVKRVDVKGADERMLRVRLSPRQAAARGLTPSDVARALDIAGRGAPIGDLESMGQELLLTAETGLQTPDQLADVPILVAGGTHVRLGDIAIIEEVWTPPSITHRVDGQPAIDLVVLPQDDADALAVVPQLRAWAVERAQTLSPGLGLIAYDDSARLVQGRLAVLASNGLVGLLLVALTLVVFIGGRNAGLVVWGMPVAWLGAVTMMYLAGVTVNVVSTFGLLIVTGIIVDDAVVIVENVQRHLEMGKSRVDAAIDGTSEVAVAVFSATLTTCLAFAPLLMLEGTVGRVMRIIPLVVIATLTASLIEAFIVLPGHLGHYAREHQQQVENLPTRLLKRAYTPILAWVVTPGRRLITVGGLVVVIGLGGVLGATMKRSLTTAGNPVFVLINIDLPPSSTPGQVRKVLRDLERVAAEQASDLAIYVSGRIGEQVSPQGFPLWGSRYGQLKIGFHKDDEVLARVPAFLDVVRQELRNHPEVVSFGMQTLTGGPPSGKPIDVRVRVAVLDELGLAVDDVVAHLESRPGVFDVRTEAEQGTETWRVDVDGTLAARFGLREGEVALAARDAVEGALAFEMPVRERATEIRVVTGEPGSLQELGDLALLRGAERPVRLREVGELVRTRDMERLQRVDGQRSVRIIAELDDDITSSEEERLALDAHFEESESRFPTASLFYGGEIADAAESFAQLPAAAMLAILLIYAVLAVQFGSYLQPFIILAVVPLGVVGAITGLFLLQMDLSLIAMIGSVGLIGIVVNDSLVLVDFVNLELSQGKPVQQAVVDASITRLRPILITTVTTVFGLMPLALGIAGSEPLLAPMAVAISFGLTFATALTLVAVPVLFLIVHDLGLALERWMPGSSR